MSWTTLDLNNLLAGEPWIESEAIAVYENPIAIAEGLTDSPIIQAGWHPWNTTAIGAGDGLIYDHAVDGNVTSIETPVLSSEYQYQVVWDRLSRNASVSATLLLDLFLEQTAAYTVSGYSLGSIGAGISTQFNSGFIELQPQSDERLIHLFQAVYWGGASGNNTTATPITEDAFGRFTRTAATRITRMRLRADITDGIRSGKAFLYRRKWEGR